MILRIKDLPYTQRVKASRVNSVNNGIPMNTTWANIVRNPTLDKCLRAQQENK